MVRRCRRRQRARRANRRPSRSRRLRACVLLPAWVGVDASRPRGTVAGAHRQALSGATPCCRSGCLTPPGGAGLMRAVYAASERGAVPAVVISIRSAVSGTALPPVAPHHLTRERKTDPPRHCSTHTEGCPMSEPAGVARRTAELLARG